MNKKAGGGFTLIELMIAVVIVAILASIAIPAYQQYVIRSYRNVAKGDLMEIQQWMERNYSLTGRYDQDPSGQAITAPLFTKSPRDGTGSRYVISFSVAPSQEKYTLLAAAQSNQNDTQCGDLTLSSAGDRTASKTSAVNICWGK